MTTAKVRLVLALTLSLGLPGMAQAVTVAGAGNTTATQPATVEKVTNGTITSVDVKRGVLAVSGQVVHFTPRSVTFSDDRKQRDPDGVEGLKPGDKVTVRSVVANGENQAIQIVVKD